MEVAARSTGLPLQVRETDEELREHRRRHRNGSDDVVLLKAIQSYAQEIYANSNGLFADVPGSSEKY